MDRNTEENEFLKATEELSSADKSQRSSGCLHLLWFHLIWFVLGVSSVLFLFSKFLWS